LSAQGQSSIFESGERRLDLSQRGLTSRTKVVTSWAFTSLAEVLKYVLTRMREGRPNVYGIGFIPVRNWDNDSDLWREDATQRLKLVETEEKF